MNKILIICGPTAIGKTDFALKIAKKFDGEIISADSRQVYKEINIISGKDLPTGRQVYPQTSNIKWRDKFLTYYLIQGIKVWLYDVVYPNEEFNVSYWHECALKIISDVSSRGKLPIVVGGTGFYIKSLTDNIASINVPVNSLLRKDLASMSVEELFTKLKLLDNARADQMNDSDKNNPRRLIRAIEIANNTSQKSITQNPQLDILSFCLTTEVSQLIANIKKRVAERIVAGALDEYHYLKNKYDSSLPSMQIPGIADWENWGLREKQYAKRQLVWFKKQPAINWIDQINPDWRVKVEKLIRNWYN